MYVRMCDLQHVKCNAASNWTISMLSNRHTAPVITLRHLSSVPQGTSRWFLIAEV
jgi:hypothetical protein